MAPDAARDAALEEEERRQSLRRLDDVLELLEQMNLREIRELPELVERRLLEIGIEKPRNFTIPQLIEKVWASQQPYLIKVVVERRRRRRRRAADPVSGAVE